MNVPELQRVDRVGVELEGAWEEHPEGETIKEDGSIHCEDFGDFDYNRVGEIVSVPLSDMDEMHDWVMRCYPDEMDSGCGLHVHLSVKDKNDMLLLASNHFWEYFQRYMRSWTKRIVNRSDRRDMEYRLNGNNSYCIRDFESHGQLFQGCGGRYTQLNFSAWHKFETLEVRVLPMFNSKKRACRAIFTVVRCFESYLRGQTATGRTARAELETVLSTIIRESDVDMDTEQLIVIPSVTIEPSEDLEIPF